MALRAVYDIDVDDTKFRKFKELFDRYQAALAGLPKDWQKVASGVGATTASFEQLAKNAQRQSAADRSRADNEKNVNAIARSTAVVWTGLIETVGTVDKHLMHATGSLLKWSTLTATFSGLLGGGTLFGIDRLAASVSAQRKSALGLGISYGQQGAFNTNYSRLINSQSLLSNVAGAKYDVTSPAYAALLASGISPQTISKDNAAELSTEFLHKIDKLFPQGTDRGLIGAQWRAYGFDNLMPLKDGIARLSASPEEKQKIDENNARDTVTNNLKEQAQRKWADLITQLDRSAGNIRTDLAERLKDIEPGLEKVSNSFVDVVAALADKGVIKQWVTGLAEGLEGFAAYVGTTEFQTGVSDFTKWVGNAAVGVWDFLKEVAPDMPALKDFGGSSKSPFGDLSDVHFGGASSGGGAVASQATREAYIRQRAIAYGIDPNVAVRVARSEGLNALADRQGGLGDQGTSGGDFQLHVGGGLGDEFRRLTGLDPLDPANWQAEDDFALSQASRGGWTPWHGATRIGVTPWEGISGNTPTVVVRSNTGNNPVLSNALVANPYTAVGP